jgi:hypothetical protein
MTNYTISKESFQLPFIVNIEALENERTEAIIEMTKNLSSDSTANRDSNEGEELEDEDEISKEERKDPDEQYGRMSKEVPRAGIVAGEIDSAVRNFTNCTVKETYYIMGSD